MAGDRTPVFAAGVQLGWYRNRLQRPIGGRDTLRFYVNSGHVDAVLHADEDGLRLHFASLSDLQLAVEATSHAGQEPMFDLSDAMETAL